jgi:hypothetical protein
MGFSFCAIGQLIHTRSYYSQNGRCSKSIILDSAGYFFNESGCEGRSNICFGRYKLGQDNIIKFHFLPFDSIAPIKEINQVSSTETNDSNVTISFYDRFGEQLTNNVGILVIDTSNKTHEMWTDQKGQIRLNCFIFKELTLIQFITIYGDATNIPISKKSLKIYLNLPGGFFMYPELILDKPQNINLELKENGLFDPKTKRLAYTPFYNKT